MASILGIIGSARLWGNSELLVRQALRGAQLEGATTRMIRLTDLRLESCTGCMHCAIGGKPCPLDDDMAWLVEQLQAADGVALAAPTYFLGPAATVKLALDRLLMVTGQVGAPLPPPRPALTIATAGLQGWRGVALPYLNALVAAFGFRSIESLTAIAPGPGEILLDDEMMGHIFDIGRRLGQGYLDSTPTATNTCPVCRSDAFVLHGNQATCPICGREATVQRDESGLRLCFSPEAGSDPRWTPEGLRKHMIEWVQATGPRFLAHRQAIKARRKPYRQMDVDWLCPPSADDR
jgi:NAD(P)H-dependent FMN reductase